MRTKKGTISSAKMTGTVKVTVDTTVFHPVYKKRFRRSKNYLADVNGHDLHEGDVVEMTECAPISKNKRFKVTQVITQGPRVSDMKEEAALAETMKPEKKVAAPEKTEEKKENAKTEAEEKDAQNEKQADDNDSPEKS